MVSGRKPPKLELYEAAYHSTGYLPAIRELVLSPSFREDPEWIASTLRPPIKPIEARQALDTLLELGLLQRTPAMTGIRRGCSATFA